MNETKQATMFEDTVTRIRRDIKAVASDVKIACDAVKKGNHISAQEDGPAILAREDRGEMIANLMLAYCALEDASMRLGTSIQASNGGTSVYDRASAVGG